jgi:hypothetical protein
LPGIYLVLISGIFRVLTGQWRRDYHLSVLTLILTLISLLDLFIVLTVLSPRAGTRRPCPEIHLINWCIWICTAIVYGIFVEIRTPPQFWCVRRRIVFVALTIHQEI